MFLGDPVGLNAPLGSSRYPRRSPNDKSLSYLLASHLLRHASTWYHRQVEIFQWLVLMICAWDWTCVCAAAAAMTLHWCMLRLPTEPVCRRVVFEIVNFISRICASWQKLLLLSSVYTKPQVILIIPLYKSHDYCLFNTHILRFITVWMAFRNSQISQNAQEMGV